ncbi:hypothetical protein BC940DRAFT_17390 [Gongronella butleri]|nr:hypothetical protein BC940DRAFT_17390 [Gongronella butleri]
MRLDPFPKFSEQVGEALKNPRLIVFSIVMTKMCLDRVYKFASVVNPTPALDNGGNETLDILEYHHPLTGRAVYDFLDSYSLKQRLAYQSLSLFDSGFVLFRALPLMLLVHWAFSQAPAKIRPGLWIILVNVFIDLTENALIVTLMKTYPRQLPNLAQWTAYVIEAKWYSFWAVVALAFVSGLVGIYYSFHSMLAGSVLMEKDRQEKLRARQHVQQVLQRSAKNKAASSSAGKKTE